MGSVRPLPSRSLKSRTVLPDWSREREHRADMPTARQRAHRDRPGAPCQHLWLIWSGGRVEMLPALAADLVRREVALIAATGGTDLDVPCVLDDSAA